jgi:HEAT repeat protein
MRNIVLFSVGLALLAAGARADDEKKPAPAKPIDVPGFWTADELRRIDQGLDVLNVTRKDLGFQKRPIDDPFRLPVVNQILDEPLSIGEVAAEWDAAARTGDTYQILTHALSVFQPDPIVCGERSPRTIEDAEIPDALPSHAVEALRSLLGLLPRTATRSWPIAREVASDSELGRSLLRKALLSQVESPREKPDAPDMSDAEFLQVIHSTRPQDEYGRLVTSCVAEVARTLRTSTITWTGRQRVGDVVLYGTGDDVHGPEDDDAVLVIDLGGNDTYTHGASANLLTNHPVSIVIDLAGDDRYIGGNDFSFGGALGGVAIQWDCAGNDTYVGGNCSCGAGILGVGVLVDEGGNDTYRVKDFGEGAGAFGIGLLLDKSGNDYFHADLYGQGFGSTWGCGMLVELAGQDVYDAGGEHVDEPLWRDRYASLSQGFGFGGRPDRSGGVGVLVDVSGNDRYSCDIFGQGCSYWFSLGLLIDDDGHDTYACGQYGQGSGIHLSCGMLLDRHGQDNYYDANGVGMGGAHDYGVGFLVDREGDDYYSGGGCAQGSGHTNSVGMLIDDAGDDGYSTVRGVTQGSASWTRNTGGIGLLLDGAGHDSYSETTRDSGVAVRDTIGACIDEPTPPEKPSENPMNAAISKEDAEKKVVADGQTEGKWDLDKLWKIVSAWEVGDNTVIIPIAKQRFFALGQPALDRAFENFDDKHGLAIRAVEYTVKEFMKSDRVGVIARLIEKTKDKDKLVRKNAVLLVTNLKVEEALPRLVEMLATDPDTTGGVLMALAAMKTAPPEVVAMLKHAREPTAVQAAVCLGAVADEKCVAALVAAMGPDFAFPVRLAAQDRLAALGAAAVSPLSAVASDASAPRMQRRNALRALGQTKSADACGALAAALADPDALVRLSAMTASTELLKSLDAKSGQWLDAALGRARETEKDPLVRRLAGK